MMELNRDIHKAYHEQEKERAILVGNALYIVLDHFGTERAKVALTKGRKGTCLSFPLAGGWQLVKDWDWPDEEGE